jgi:competence protein CoiA
MKFAIQGQKRVEAAPQATGQCPCCESDLTAKCGSQKAWHWSHKGTRHCDLWWENETAWHRNWKDHFPGECHEVVHFADDGEKHVADIKTPGGLVIEFQHSAMSVDEKNAREKFYKNMIWIVDGTRLKTDKARFKNVFSSDQRAFEKWQTLTPEQIFPKSWLNRSVPVYFDTGDTNHLICLLPKASPQWLDKYYDFVVVPNTIFRSNFVEILDKYGNDFFTQYPEDFYIDLLVQDLADLDSKIDWRYFKQLLNSKTKIPTEIKIQVYENRKLSEKLKYARSLKSKRLRILEDPRFEVPF